MNFDDLNIYPQLDPDGMLPAIIDLPHQLQVGWESVKNLPLPDIRQPRAIVICGMGGSAIAGDFVTAYTSSESSIPVTVLRDYDLPAWAAGRDVLVVASSHSGNTEETLSTYRQAVERQCSRLVITTGGQLLEIASNEGAPVWKFNHHGQPRAAVGFSFIYLLGLMTRLGLITDPSQDIQETIEVLNQQAALFDITSPVSNNPAKRMAGQMVGRHVSVFGSGILSPVARRWKTQINELAKAWAQHEELPEADHNLAAAVLNPEDSLSKTLSIFLQSDSDHPRNRLRGDLTRRGFMVEGIGTDTIYAVGSSRLAHMWSLIQYGDFASFYLAIAYGVNPTPVNAIESLKKAMK